MAGTDENPGPEVALASGSFERVRLPNEFLNMLDIARERETALIVTRSGRMAAVVIPMTAPEAFQAYLAKNPEIAAEMQEAHESFLNGEIQTAPASEIFGATGDLPPQQPVTE